MPSRERIVLFSGGGTVGHLAPGFALAAALEAVGVECLFATPGEAVEAAWFEGRPAPLRLQARRLPRTLPGKLAFPAQLGLGGLRARRLLRKKRIGCVVGLGGWPCAPAVVGARLSKTPLVFLVPDAVPGLVIRKFAHWAGRIYLAHDEARAGLPVHDGLRTTGPLLRRLVRDGRSDPAAFGLRADRQTLLVTGGSLGAKGLNEAFLAGLEAALAKRPELAARIQVLHAAGIHAPALEARYKTLGLVFHVTPFIRDMGKAYRTADLALSRGGASTCAELQATATPAIIVPYPHHVDQQQVKNARPLCEAGAARLIREADLVPEVVQRDVLDLLEDPEGLRAMRAGHGDCPIDAATETAADLIRYLQWEA